MADDRPGNPETEAAVEPSYRERLRQLDQQDAEEERQAEAEFIRRTAEREARKKAPLTVQERPVDAGRGSAPVSPGRPLLGNLSAQEMLDPERQRALHEAAQAGRLRFVDR